MSQTISIFSTVTQADNILVEVPENGLLQDRYFPTADKDMFQSKEVLFDWDKSDLKAGTFVKKGYINGQTVTYRGNAVEPPRVGISDSIDPTDQDRVLFEQLCYQQGSDSPSRADAMEDLKRIKAARLVQRAHRSIEKTCANVLFNNAVVGQIQTSSTDDTMIDLDITYYDPIAGNDQRFIPKYAWGNVSATPYQDVVAMVNALVEHGGKAEDLLISPEAWKLLQKDNDFKTQFELIHTEDSVLFGRNIKDARHVAIAVFGGYMLNVIVYYGAYKNDSGKLTPFLDKGFVCILSENCGRTLCGGCTLMNPASISAEDVYGVNSFVQRRGKYIVSQFVDLNNQQLMIRCESRPLPAPYRPWQWITMDAQNTNSISEGVQAPDVSIEFDSDDENATLPADLSHQAGGSKITIADATTTTVGVTFDGYYVNGVKQTKDENNKYTVPNVDTVWEAVFE